MRRAVAALLLAGGLLGAPAGPAAAVPDAPPGSTETGRAPLMIVFDASGSMKLDDADGKPRIDAARSAVRRVIGDLPDDATVGLQTYGTKTGADASEQALGCQDVTVLQPVAALDRDALRDGVEGIAPSGYSPIGLALNTAADALPDTGKRTVLLVTDGYDYCATPEPCEVAGRLADSAPDLTVHVLGVDVSDADAQQLRCIATATGGRYIDADDDTTDDAAEQLAPLLAAGYQRPLRTFRASGIPIEGAPEVSDAAPVMTPGSYLDRTLTRGTYSADGGTKRGTVRYYRVPFASPMTPWASATLVGDVRSEERHNMGLRLTLVSESDDACLPTVERTRSSGDSDPMPLLTVAVGGTDAGAVAPGDDEWATACAPGEPVYLRVERLGEYRSGTALPVEIEFRAEPPVAAPQAADPGSVGGELDPPQDRAPTPAAGGSDFATAPRIPPGSTVSDTLVAGETRFYAVTVDWGQRLRYRLTPTGLGTPVGADTETARVLLRNPLRTPVAGSPDSVSGSFRLSKDGDGNARAITGSSATAVRYGNRNSDDEKVRGYAFAGTYYLQLSLSPSKDSNELTVPFTLTVDAVDDPAGAGGFDPKYLPGDASGVSRNSPTPASAAGQDAVSGGAGRSGVPGWVWGLGGAAAALLLASLFTLLRRRSVDEVEH